jgi:hypothetical protein
MKASTSVVSNRPRLASAPALNVGVGLAAMKFRAPPVAFSPKRVPCGPLRTSSRSMSSAAPRVSAENGIGTSS